jgi:hypothetical protein
MGELAISVAHVVPPTDTKDHDLVSGQCWCNPTIEFRWDRITLYHHLCDPLENKGPCHGPREADPEAALAL